MRSRRSGADPGPWCLFLHALTQGRTSLHHTAHMTDGNQTGAQISGRLLQGATSSRGGGTKARYKVPSKGKARACSEHQEGFLEEVTGWAQKALGQREKKSHSLEDG